MKTTYLVWKDPACGGKNPDWQEISGQEFLALVRAVDSPKRHFIKLDSSELDGADGAVVMEASETVYAEWKREKNHRAYLRSVAKDTSVVSYHALEGEDGTFGEELLVDTSLDIEQDFIRSQEPELLRTALSRLSEDERQMIEYLYLSANPGTVRGYEEMTGIPKSTVNRRQQAVLAKLKNFFDG
ncbi:MAG: hypothetical protein LBS74_09135 [Oscillospiraceae bacterium]|jgi:DNA-directed RNA polymerase specialized sigma24 family protein|nr:hypothetical protein [Oscillospiraceae bacterium]